MLAQMPDQIPVDVESAALFVGGAWLIVWIVVMLLFIIGWWKIFSKAGYSGALALLWFVPIANIIVFFWFAFSEWPVLRRARESRGRRMDDF